MTKHIIIIALLAIVGAVGEVRADTDKWSEILLSPSDPPGAVKHGDSHFDKWRAQRARICENRGDESKAANKALWRATDYCDLPDLGVSRYWKSAVIKQEVAPLSTKEFGIPLIVRLECPFWREGRGVFPVFQIDIGYDPKRDIRFAASREITIDDEFVPTEWKFKWDKNKAETFVTRVDRLAVAFMGLSFFDKKGETIIAKMKRHNKLVFGVDIEGVGDVFYHISLQGITAKIKELERFCAAYQPEDYLPL